MFETVGYKFAPGGDQHGYAASFQVVEAQPAYPIRFDDLGVPDKDLDGIPARQGSAVRAAPGRYQSSAGAVPAVGAGIYQGARQQGHGRRKSHAATAPAAPGEFVILFRPARSDPAVAEVAFEGNQVIPTSALQNSIAEVAVGLPYKEESFRQCLDSSIRPLYDARGRIRVKFTKIAVEKAKDVQGLAVKVTLEEGETYDLGDVRIEGAPHFEPVRLLKTGKVQAWRSGRLRRNRQGRGTHQEDARTRRLHA